MHTFAQKPVGSQKKESSRLALPHRSGLAGRGLPLQPKLAISTPGDIYEQEADRVADQVMRMPEPAVQRKYNTCEEEEKIRRKPLASASPTKARRSVARLQPTRMS